MAVPGKARVHHDHGCVAFSRPVKPLFYLCRRVCGARERCEAGMTVTRQAKTHHPHESLHPYPHKVHTLPIPNNDPLTLPKSFNHVLFFCFRFNMPPIHRPLAGIGEFDSKKGRCHHHHIDFVRPTRCRPPPQHHWSQYKRLFRAVNQSPFPFYNR